MKSKILKQIISLILCFGLLMPTVALFAEEPTITVENSESEKYEIVDGSAIGQASGEKYLVKFVKSGNRYTVVDTKPTSGWYEEVDKIEGKAERVLVTPARTETYYVSERRAEEVPYRRELTPERRESYNVTKTVYDIVGYGKRAAGTDTVTKYKYITERKIVKSGYWSSTRVKVKDGYYKRVLRDGALVRQWVPPTYRTKKTYNPAVYTQTSRKVAYTEEVTRYVTDYKKPIKRARTVTETKYRTIPATYESGTKTVYRNVSVKKYRNIPAVYKTVIKDKVVGTAYRIKLPSTWEVQRSSAVSVTMTSVWAPNGQRQSAYLKNGKTYLMNHRRLPNGYISYAGGAYHLKISDTKAQKSTSFDPSVYERSGGKYQTSSQESAARKEEERKSRQRVEYNQYANEISSALSNRLREIRAIVNSKSYLSDLLTQIISRENYINANKVNPKTWTNTGDRTTSMFFNGEAYNISNDNPLAEGYIYYLNEKYYEVQADGSKKVINLDESVFEESKGKYKTKEEQDANKKVPKDVWDATGNKVDAYMQKDKYYLGNGNDIPNGYVVSTENGYRYKTSGNLVDIAEFDLNTFIKTNGQFFNFYQQKLNSLSYTISDKLNDSSVISQFARDFGITADSLTQSVKSKINEIDTLYPKGLNPNAVNATTNEIQAALKKLGKTIDVDGKYGPKTKAVVKAYQIDNDLTPTEYCDKATKDAILNAVGIVDEIPAESKKSITTLLDYLIKNPSKKDKVEELVNNKLVFELNHINEFSKNNKESFKELKELYNLYNTADMKTHFPSAQKAIFDKIAEKGKFYFREPSGQCVVRKYPSGTGEWISHNSYIKWLERISRESSKYASYSKSELSELMLKNYNELMHGSIYEEYMTLKALYNESGSDNPELVRLYTEKKKECESVIKNIHQILKSNRFPNSNALFSKYFANGINSFDTTAMDAFKDQLGIELEYNKPTMESGFFDGVTEDVKDLIDLFKAGNELAKEFSDYVSTSEGKAQFISLIKAKIVELSTWYLKSLFTGTLSLKLMIIWNKVTIKIWKGIVKGTIEGFKEKLDKPLDYNIGFVLGKLTFETVSGVITGGCAVIIKAILSKTIHLIKIGTKSIGYVFEILEKVWKNPKFDNVKKFLMDESGSLKLDFNFNREISDKVADATKKGEKIVDDNKNLIDNIIDDAIEGTSNLVTSASDYATKIGKRTDVVGTYPSSASASDILRGELKGVDIPNPPYKNAAHHIVPWNDPRALDARNILDDFNIDYNSASNGVFLPMEVNEYTGDAVLHIGSHSADYVTKVTSTLEEVVAAGGTKDDIISALNGLREGLLNGTLKLNN